MNRRKKIYRGFNRRNKVNQARVASVIILLLVAGLAGGYGYIKFKDIDVVEKFSSGSSKVIANITSKLPFLDKLSFLDKSDSGVITSDDISKELGELGKESDEKEDVESSNVEEVDDIKLAKTDGWNFYTIQVASVQDDKELTKIKTELNEKKIPCSIVEVDGMKKVQTYSFFEKEDTRTYLEEVKAVYPDAFLSEMKIPMLSLEYTSKYEYVGEISSQLNKLITNFKDESEFWKKNKENVNKEEYNKILTSRSDIIKVIEKEVEKIDYSGMESFKDSLSKYINDVNENITQSSKAANEEQYYISKANYVSCMQGYFSFINIIKGV